MRVSGVSAAATPDAGCHYVVPSTLGCYRVSAEGPIRGNVGPQSTNIGYYMSCGTKMVLCTSGTHPGYYHMFLDLMISWYSGSADILESNNRYYVIY